MSVGIKTTRDKEWLTVNEAAARLGMTTGRIRQLLLNAELAGKKVGPIWLIPSEEVQRYAAKPQTVGRPRKGHRSSGRA